MPALRLQNNWVIETIDLNGNSTTNQHDNIGRVIKSVSAIGQETLTQYDKSSNALTTTIVNDLASGGNQQTSYTYDRRNLLLEENLNPGTTLERKTNFTYDQNGNKINRTFPNGDITTCAYDSLDRLSTESYQSAPAENRSYQYNNNGAVITASDESGITTPTIYLWVPVIIYKTNMINYL